MAVCELHLSQNNALQKMRSCTVILPEGKSGPFPVLYLLHGLSDDHTAWTRWTSLERYVSDLPLIVVMPNGERGWYTDAVAEPRAAFETLIARDIVGFIDRTFQTIPTRAGRVIAGLSMGGYGALKLALKRPDLFRAAVSHSGAVEMASRSLVSAPGASDGEIERERERIPIFGPNPQGGDNDLSALARRADPATRPALRIDCGVDDFLIEHNRRFHILLTDMGVPHEYAEHPGAHDWAYWDAHIFDTITFFARQLWPDGGA